MKMNKLAVIAMLGLSVFSLTACNKGEEAATVEISKEEQAALEAEQNKLIAEYAAGILMKYNSGSNTRVLDGYKLVAAEEADQAKKALEEKRQQERAAYEAETKGKNQENSSESDGADTGSGQTVLTETKSYVNDIAAATGISDFAITYAGYEITPTYPTAENNMYFAVDAGEGRTFIVTKFSMLNKGSQAGEINFLNLEPQFTLRTSGKNIRAHKTMLLEDLSMFKGSLEAGQAVEGVLIFETTIEMANSIDGMELIITMGDQNIWMLLEAGTGTQDLQTTAEVILDESTVIEAGVDQTEADNTNNENVAEQEPSTEEVILNQEEQNTQETEDATITTVGSHGAITVEPAN